FPRPFGFRLVVRLGVSRLELRPSQVAIQSVRATAHPFNAYRSSTDKPGLNPAGRELSFSTFTFLLTLSVITCCQLMQGRDSEIEPTSSFQRIPVVDTLQESPVSAPRGSLLAFAPDDLALRLNPSPTHSSSAFAFSTILYPQPDRLALRRAFPFGRITGLPRSMKTAESVRSRFSAGGATSATGEVRAPVPDPLPFWFKRESRFRWSELTTLISDSHSLTRRLNPSL